MTCVEESKNCNNCLCWLKYCQAECCKVFIIYNLKPDFSKKFFRFRTDQKPGKALYYKLRGCEFKRGWLKIPIEYCEYKNGITYVNRKCDWLTPDNKCMKHPDKKPFICQDLTLRTAKESKYYLTPNCLFRYKLEGENGKERKD